MQPRDYYEDWRRRAETDRLPPMSRLAHFVMAAAIGALSGIALSSLAVWFILSVLPLFR